MTGFKKKKKKSAGYFSQHARMKKKSFAEKFLTSTVQQCSLRPNCLQTYKPKHPAAPSTACLIRWKYCCCCYCCFISSLRKNHCHWKSTKHNVYMQNQTITPLAPQVVFLAALHSIREQTSSNLQRHMPLTEIQHEVSCSLTLTVNRWDVLASHQTWYLIY